MISTIEKLPFKVFTVTTDIQRTLDFLKSGDETKKLRHAPDSRNRRNYQRSHFARSLVIITMNQREELTFKFYGCSKKFKVGEKFIFVSGKIVPLERIIPNLD
jgi:hypothetical protein